MVASLPVMLSPIDVHACSMMAYYSVHLQLLHADGLLYPVQLLVAVSRMDLMVDQQATQLDICVHTHTAAYMESSALQAGITLIMEARCKLKTACPARTSIQV